MGLCGFSSEKTLVLYHGTTQGRAQSIWEKKQFNPSADGRLGTGYYFAENKDDAIQIAKYRAMQENQQYGSVITFIVKVKSEKDFVRSMHPKWASIQDDFPEYCVRRFKKLELADLQHFNNAYHQVLQNFASYLDDNPEDAQSCQQHN